MAFSIAAGQMMVNGVPKLGHEWIELDQEYYKIKVHQDGVYRIRYSQLIDAGIDFSSVSGQEFQMFHLGKEIPIYVTSSSNLTSDDYIEFFGQWNRGEMDSYHYPSMDAQLNPDYSMITDTNTYFLTWKQGSKGLRFQDIENDLSGQLPQPEKFYFHSQLLSFTERFYKPTEQGQDLIKYSNLVTAEGYSLPITHRQTINIPASRIVQEGQQAKLRVRFGINKVEHLIHLTWNGKRLKEYDLSFEYHVFNDVFDFPLAELRTNNQLILEGTLGSTDRLLLSQVEIIYPREFQFDNTPMNRFKLSLHSSARLLDIGQFSFSETNVLLDLKNQTRMRVSPTNNKMLIQIKERSLEHDFVLFNERAGQGFQWVEKLDKVVMPNHHNKDAEYVIITSRRLKHDSDNGGMDWIEAYADYRSTPEGGGFETAIIVVEDLYNLYGYGIDRHFFAINNFALFAERNWPSLKFFFVIGKGIEYQEYRTTAQQQNPQTAPFFVPVWGNPGSDNLLFAERGKNYPVKPVGRLSVIAPFETGIYLTKIKNQESNNRLPQTIQDKYWTKRFIHLSGGANASEQSVIRSFLRRMKDISEAGRFGADVATFEKTSADPLQTATSDRIIRLINDGVSLLTFFGHSAVGTFDFSLEDPSKYSNGNRLPMIISLGCYSGNIFVPGRIKGLSEAFVLQPESGAITFAAASGTAYISTQGQMGINLYEELSGDGYGQSVGELLRNTLITLSTSQAIGFVTLLQQYVLHGDPAYGFITHKGPDYLIDFESIQTTPTIISTSDRNFQLGMDIVNIGSGVADSIVVMVKHTSPEAILIDTLFKTIKAPGARKRIYFDFENKGILLIGRNSIMAEVNFSRSIDEHPPDIAFNNNQIDDGQGGDQFFFVVADNAARPVYPLPFSIASQNRPVLKASTSNVFTTPQNYIVEIDTSAHFDHPLERNLIFSGGGLIEWTPSSNFIPGLVYYWRISPEEENPVLGRIWSSSSFTYIPNENPAWRQGHYFQFLENAMDGIILTDDRRFQFDTSGFFININNKLFNADVPPNFIFNLEGSAASVRPWNFMTQGMAVFVMDPITGAGWENSGGDFGSINTNNFGSFRCFGYDTANPQQRRDLINLLENIIPDGHYVFLFSVIRNLNSDTGARNWREDEGIIGTHLFDVLLRQGSAFIESMEENFNVPYVFMYRKGQGVLDEVMATDISGEANGAAFVPILRGNGKLSSPAIGPALEWNELQMHFNGIKASDILNITIKGISQQGIETIILESQWMEIIDLSNIDAKNYPFIKIELFAINESEKLIPQLQSWKVKFTSATEWVMNQKEKLDFHADTIQQGDILHFATALLSIGTIPIVDSVKVEFTIIDAQNRSESTVKSYALDQTTGMTEISFEKDTKDFSGKHQFSLEVNAGGQIPEVFSFNNFGIKEFFVFSDRQNPLLDVTFDGIRIMNGDIVSPQPEIIVTLTDENPFFLLDDPALFEMKLDTGNINALLTIPLDGQDVEFFPATTGKNQAKIIFHPQLKEGSYTLFVQGKDKSNNFSGDNDYRISFRVIENNSVSHIFNYPNPFSTATQFVFTLTGSVPEHMKIQIMTISGKVVREILKEELGPLQMGVNRTQYWWDGTDEYGDRLANGVYLYRIVMKDESGIDFDHFRVGRSPSDLDRFFNKGFGKMVIIR
ncbi:MAG TPA: C25 family cysteine peptidase [Saprospiraceae bacterium]|nr:C25 family cysteine peptidase [Saprospiraceae bacterium]